MVFDGIRAAESRVRKEYIPIWYHPSFKCLSVSPIFDWSDHDVISYINSNGIPKTLLHSLGSSTECWCGAYKTETDFRNLYDLNKAMFNKLSKVEQHNKTDTHIFIKTAIRSRLKNWRNKFIGKRSSSPQSWVKTPLQKSQRCLIGFTSCDIQSHATCDENMVFRLAY